MIITIDGPAASGKGTLAAGLAAHFGLPHLDTGLLYRAVGKAVAAYEGSPEFEQRAIDAARSLDIGTLKREELLSQEVGSLASKVAVIGEVRQALFDAQRQFALQPGGAVLDGRDTGTRIAPDADVKLFVKATPMIRAQRRHAELRKQGVMSSLDKVLADIRARDDRDTRRSEAPLVQAADAALLDTSFLSIDAAVQRAIVLVEARRAA